MVDFQYISNGSNLLMHSSNNKRTHVYGMMRHVMQGTSSRLMRCPPLKYYNIKVNGVVQDSWPVTTSCTYRDSSGTTSYLHPVLDDKGGVRVYTFNMVNSSQDYLNYESFPTSFLVHTSRGYTIGCNQAITFLTGDGSSTQAYLNAMPETLPTSPSITGALHSTIGTLISVQNNKGTVDYYNGYLDSPYGTFSYIRVANNTVTTSKIKNRTDVTYQPSIFAVVDCTLCTPVGITNTTISTTADPTNNTTNPIILKKEDSNIVYTLKDHYGSDAVPAAAVWMDGAGSWVVKKIYNVTGTGAHAIYFLWTPLNGSSVKTLSSSSPFYIIPPPVIKCKIGDSSVGDTISCRILQYGIEFNY
jgi:hypothetical protein